MPVSELGCAALAGRRMGGRFTGQVLGALQDVALFNAVRLDAETGVLQWPNGADFDPETLRNWASYRDEFVAMASRWRGSANR